MKFVRSKAALMALACCTPMSAAAQTATIVSQRGVVLIDQYGNPITVSGSGITTSPAQTAPTAQTLTSGTPAVIPGLSSYTSAKFQIAGLNADSIQVLQSLDCTNYVTATVLKNDLTTTAATALTGTTGNGIYSVMVFGGCLEFIRTGSADTLTLTYRGTN